MYPVLDLHILTQSKHVHLLYNSLMTHIAVGIARQVLWVLASSIIVVVCPEINSMRLYIYNIYCLLIMLYFCAVNVFQVYAREDHYIKLRQH